MSRKKRYSMFDSSMSKKDTACLIELMLFIPKLIFILVRFIFQVMFSFITWPFRLVGNLFGGGKKKRAKRK